MRRRYSGQDLFPSCGTADPAAIDHHSVYSGVLSSPLFFHGFGDVLPAGGNLRVVLAEMREQAVRAVLDAALVIAEISAAAGSQRIKRAPAEEAVEILRVCARVAGKEFTFPVGEILIIFCGGTPVTVIFHGSFPLFCETSGIYPGTKSKGARGLPAPEMSFPSGKSRLPEDTLIYYLTSLL